MLITILLQTPDQKIVAPGRLIHHDSLRILMQDAVDQYCGGQPANWMLDETAAPRWPAASAAARLFGNHGEAGRSAVDQPEPPAVVIMKWPDEQLTAWEDAKQPYFLIAAAERLRSLLTQLDHLLLIPVDAANLSIKSFDYSWLEAEEIAEWSDLAAEGFRPAAQLDAATAQLDTVAAQRDTVAAQRDAAAALSIKAVSWDRPSAVDHLRSMMATGGCDLHVHTNASDGSDTPHSLVERVLLNGLRAFSITDHDNLDALEPANHYLAEQCASRNIPVPELIPGVEISVDESGQERHILGYFPRGGIEKIEDFLTGQRDLRRQRNEKMVRRLQELGYAISLEDFLATGTGSVGRLQAAILLRDQGYFANIREAFDRLLGFGQPAYVERPRPDPAYVIRLIRAAGGVAVLAHPDQYGWCSAVPGSKLVSGRLLAELEKFKQWGLQGVEAFHGDAPPNIQDEISAAGRALGFLLTGGSDDHGLDKEHAAMYSGSKTFFHPSEILVAAAIVPGPLRGEQPTWLLARRNTPGSGQGYWEFPGGKVEPGESAAEGLARELDEELGVQAEVGALQMVVTYEYPAFHLILAGFATHLPGARLVLAAHDEIRYVTAPEALQIKLLPADIAIFEYFLNVISANREDHAQ
jgi:3',5'-nucleoside bisphosphate phosphatase